MSRALIAGAVLGAGLISGGMLMQSGAWREAGATTASARLLDEVMARVSSDYIDSVSVDALYRNAAFGLVKELEDPYSALLTPERLRQLRETTTGRYAGIGVELDLRDGIATVIAPLPGTPADSAGLRPGDQIVTIDAAPVRGRTMEEIEQLLRGRPGSQVRLGVERGDLSPTFTLTRREIVVRPVQRAELLGDGVGYVALATFNEQTADEVRQAVDALRRRGARALVLDLRQNAGGLLEQGVDVAGLFLDAGQPIARTRGRTLDAHRDFVDDTKQPWPDLRMAVLVDSGTASAAEIIAGALQDNGRATIVGGRTYGKGSAQSLLPVQGGLALKLTTARWFTPKGRTIAGDSTSAGLLPDALVAAPPGQTPAPPVPLERDPVVARALRLLAR